MLKPSDSQEREQRDLSSLLEVTDSGISTEEQNSILSQIDQMFDGGSATKVIQELSYQPLKSGSFFPVLANIIVLLLTVVSVWFLFALHDRQEQSIINEGESISSAEGTILREFRQETEVELRDLQSDLSALGQERDALALHTAAIIERHTREFEQELQARMSEERARLEVSGMSRSDVEARLKQYRDELTEQHLQELAVVRAEAEQRLDEQERQLRQLSQSYEERIAEYDGARKTAFMELGRIREQQEEAELLSRQISSAYLLSLTALENGNFTSARRSLGVIEDYLARNSVSSVPVTAQRLPADRKILSALSQFIALKESGLTDPGSAQTDSDLEESAVGASQRSDEPQTDERVAALSESIDQLSRQLQSTRNELSRTRNQLGDARRELENLRELERRIRGRQGEFSTLAGTLADNAAKESEDQDNQRILAALDDKLKILEVLRSQPVRLQYSGMENLFTAYLETFEQEYQNQGYIEALQDTRLLIRSVNGGGESTAAPYLRRGGNELLKTAAQLVEELELLVSP